MIKIIKNNIHLIITIIISLIIITVSMTISKKIVFSNEIQDKSFYYFSLISYCILVFLITFFIVRFVRKIIKKDEFSIKLLKHFIIYFGIMIIVLMLIWPRLLGMG